MTLSDFLAEWHSPSPTLLVHTSGSTGEPKPMLVEKKRMIASAATTLKALGLRRGDTALLCMPLKYIAGKMMVVRSIVGGLRLTSVEPSSHPLATIDGRLDFAAMVPLQVYGSLLVEEERERLRNIKHLIIGGGAIDEALAAKLKDFPNAVYSTYGMTETLSHIALRRINGSKASQWYQPFDGVGVSLNADGCLVIDAPDVCAERLVTNDRAVIAADGRRFRIIGRKDNVVCSGGIKLQIEEIERKLRTVMSLPFMITKMADERLGEAVVMLVEKADGDENDKQKINALCKMVLAKFEKPYGVFFISSLPLTETGKPARHEAELLVRKMTRQS